MTDVFLGLDLGTSGLKGIALDAAGTALAHASHAYPTARPEPGASEQDPAHWLAASAGATRALLDQLGAGCRVRAVGLSAMLPTLVLADAGGEPVGPAITWEDARAEDHGARLRALAGADELYRVTGQWLDGRYLLSMYLGALDRGVAGRAATARHLLGAKDWLLGRLTGEYVTEPSTATGVGGYRLAGGWHQPVLAAAAELAGGPLPRLPDVVPSEATFPLCAEAAGVLGLPAGTPVCAGGADSVLGALGLGVCAPGEVAYVAGTSTVILGVAADWQPDPRHRYLGTPLAGVAGLGYELDLLSTGSALRWLTRLLNLGGEAELIRLAATVDALDAPAFLPYLAPGEQGALWDPELRGAVTGLSLRDGPGHLARGLLSGIVLESRRSLAVLAEAGITGGVRLAGGSGSDPAFRADLADTSGRPVSARADGSTDHSAAGAARLAAAALGEPVAAPDRHAVQVCQPRAGRAALWARLGERQDRTRLALRDIARRSL